MVRAVPLLLLASACGPSPQALEAFDVVRKPTQDCTLTGATSRNCADDATLGAQQRTGRWIFEHAPAETFTLTTEDGFTLPGIYFNDDTTILNQDPCVGGGGLCYFARHKFDSVDPKNNNCAKFGEVVAIMHRADDTHVTGVFSDTSGTDQNCGTSTVVQKIDAVTGERTSQPALAREEATK